MGTFKKKDIKNINVDELVGTNGGLIDGDDSYETTSQIKTAPQQDTDSFVATAKQKIRYPYGTMGSAYSHGSRSGSFGGFAEGEEPSEESDENVEELDEQSAIKKMVEDIVSRNLEKKDFPSKQNGGDISRNDIPDLDSLKSNEDVSAKLQELIKNITSNKITSEDKAIIINYIIKNVGVDGIDTDYKKILKSKI